MDHELEYGAVLITKGTHKGKVGYYDDDEGNKCIVYLGAPFLSPYIIISPKSLEQTSATNLSVAKWVKENPMLAQIMGVSQ